MIRKYWSLAAVVLCSVAILFFIGENRTDRNSFPVSIDEVFLEKLRAATDFQEITVSSTGGDPDFAEIAAEIIQEKHLKIRIEHFCLSSCAEYLLPAAHSITLSNKSVIGFHQNPLMINYIKETFSEFQQHEICYYSDNLEYIEKLHFEKLKNSEYWKTTLDKIELNDAGFVKKDDCIEVQFIFNNRLWLPTSNQLKSGMGLQFEGSICSDDPTCYQQTIDRSWDENTNIVVGEIVYTSKGR